MHVHPLIETLEARRRSLGLTQAQLASRSGLSEKSVRNALSAHGNPRLDSLLALVDALGLELQPVPHGFGALAPAAVSAALSTSAGRIAAPTDGARAAATGYTPQRTAVEAALARAGGR